MLSVHFVYLCRMVSNFFEKFELYECFTLFFNNSISERKQRNKMLSNNPSMMVESIYLGKIPWPFINWD